MSQAGRPTWGGAGRGVGPPPSPNPRETGLYIQGGVILDTLPKAPTHCPPTYVWVALAPAPQPMPCHPSPRGGHAQAMDHTDIQSHHCQQSCPCPCSALFKCAPLGPEPLYSWDPAVCLRVTPAAPRAWPVGGEGRWGFSYERWVGN